ncbi:RNA-guided endonuclease InsQ/TnpB family protein [Nonomuraea sp. NPDC047897]|uniref:RNA-guided endonuclease InsQ/TnpB family protein n=1 Tax=Nonomuraea sp. NPDC047897 TaxID=3364346 RepID=UPI003716AEF9
MRRSFRFLLRPTARQAAALAACREDHRQLYNAALEHRRTAYAKAGVTIRYGDQSAELKHIRADDLDGQGRWSAGSQQQTLRRLDKAFAAFFRRIKNGAKPGYPRFKGRGWFGTVEWLATKNGATWDSQPHDPMTRVYLLGIGHVRVHRHRPVKAESAGRELIAVDPRNTSRTCSRCGHCAKDNRRTQAAFACTACGHTAHADVNAATNILRAGLALRQAAQAA